MLPSFIVADALPYKGFFMAKKITLGFDGPSRLSQRIEEFLQDSELTGDALQERMHQAHSAYSPSPTKISKYVTTGRPVPTRDFVAAIAIVLGAAEAEIIEMANQPAEPKKNVKGVAGVRRIIGTKPTFNLLLGHTIWAAPVVLAAMEGRLPQIQVATYLNEEKMPVYIDPRAWGPSNCDKVNPFIRIDVPNQPKRRTKSSTPSRKLEALSAATVYNYLMKPDSNVDAVIVPGRFALEKRLTRIGCIADTRVGCLWIGPEKVWTALKPYASKFYPVDIINEPGARTEDQVKHPRAHSLVPELSAEWLAAYLLHEIKPSNELEKRFVALELETAAESILLTGFEVVGRSQGRMGKSHIVNVSTDRLTTETYQQIHNDLPDFYKTEPSGFSGMISWSPQINWLKQRYHNSELEICGLMCPLDVQPRHLTFEICVTQRGVERGSEQLFAAIVDLIGTISPICDGLNLVSMSGAESANNVWDVDETQLAKLSNYFALTPDEKAESFTWFGDLLEIRKALAPINFDAAIRGEEILRVFGSRGNRNE